MELPHSDPVGVPVVPRGYRRAPRRYPASVRAAALVLSLVFASVVVVTTAVSLGAYCLTTDTANSGDLPSAVFGPAAGEGERGVR